MAPPASPPPDQLARLAAWLQVLRPWRLVLIPGGVAAGYAVSRGGFASGVTPGLWLAMLIGLLLGAGGLLLDAWTDHDRDRRRYPQRPLPAGRLSPRPVQRAAIAALVLANLLAVASVRPALMAASGALTALILLFELGTKRVPLVGPLCRGGCHGLAILLGACAAGLTRDGSITLLLAILVPVWYVAFIDLVHQNYPHRRPRRWQCFGLLLALPMLLLSGLNGILGGGWTCMGLWLIWALFVAVTGQRVGRLLHLDSPESIPDHEESLLRNLAMMQAFWLATVGASCFVVCAALLLWPLAGILERQLDQAS